MTEARSETVGEEDSWPTFALRYTFNPDEVDARSEFDADELVVYDPRRSDVRPWLSAKRGSYVCIEDTR